MTGDGEAVFTPMTHDLVTPRLRLRRQRPDDAAAIRGLRHERDRRSARLIDAEGHPTVVKMRTPVAHGGLSGATCP
jgi:hypothetical protein